MRIGFAETDFGPEEKSEPDRNDRRSDGNAHGAGEIKEGDDGVEGKPLKEEFPTGDGGVAFA